MKNKIYLIYWDSIDDGCSLKGFVYGTEEDADACCDAINKDKPYDDHYYWEELNCLNPEKWNTLLNQGQCPAQPGRDRCP